MIEFTQKSKNEFELIFKVGDNYKFKDKDKYPFTHNLKILSFVDDYIMYRINDSKPEVLSSNDFKKKLLKLNIIL